MYNPRMLKERLDSEQKLFLIGVSVGLFYGLLIRLGSEVFPNTEAFSVMTLGFLVLLPFAIGFVTIYLVETKKAQTVSVWAFLPWVPVMGGTISTVLVYWEGMICAVLFLPISLVLASLGGLAAGYIARLKVSRTARSLTLSCVLALPLLVTPWEAMVFSQNDLRRVNTSIVIYASPEVIWRNIERVREIQPSELPSSWTHQIGFPAPVEATLSSEGVGGIRSASFTGGVLFIENVNEWVPDSRLAFSIHAQTDQIPKRTLDDHVRVGGRFFDVLRGEYVIEPVSNGVVRLHLSSEHRLSTDFNWYAGLWTDAIMKDVQATILEVIRNRCESGAK
jgi:hypothetical protein